MQVMKTYTGSTDISSINIYIYIYIYVYIYMYQNVPSRFQRWIEFSVKASVNSFNERQTKGTKRAAKWRDVMLKSERCGWILDWASKRNFLRLTAMHKVLIPLTSLRTFATLMNARRYARTRASRGGWFWACNSETSSDILTESVAAFLRPSMRMSQRCLGVYKKLYRNTETANWCFCVIQWTLQTKIGAGIAQSV